MTLAIAFGGPEMLIVLAIVMLLFGAKKLPDLARSLGQAQKEFKDGGTQDAPAEESTDNKA